MIDGVIDICSRCGEEMTLADHLTDSHKGEDGQIHLVWQHNSCGYYDEITVSKQTLKACVDFNKVVLGEIDDDERELSEDEEVWIEFSAHLVNIGTPADFGWESYASLVENAVDDVARGHLNE